MQPTGTRAVITMMARCETAKWNCGELIGDEAGSPMLSARMCAGLTIR